MRDQQLPVHQVSPHIDFWHLSGYMRDQHWNLSDNETSQVSKTLLSIRADLSNAVYHMISSHPPISNSSSPLSKALGIVSFMLQCFFSSLVWSNYLALFLHSLIFILWSTRTAKSTIRQVLFFFSYLFMYLFIFC